MSAGSQVYFVQSGANGPIKIGTARDVTNRLASLQTGSPVSLRLLGVIPGDVTVEKTLHARFDRHRIRGEWFRPVGRLKAYIAQATNEHVRPAKIPNFQTAAELDAWIRALPTEPPRRAPRT